MGSFGRHQRPQEGSPMEAPGSPRRPLEAPGGPARPREAPGGPRRAQEAPGGPRKLQESPGGSGKGTRYLVYASKGGQWVVEGRHPDFGGFKPLASYVWDCTPIGIVSGAPDGGALSMGIRGGSAGDPLGIRGGSAQGLRGSVQFWNAFGPRFGGIHPRPLRAFIILKRVSELP